MPDQRRWVIDTNIFTHFCRAGHEDIIASLAPNGVVVVPSDVSAEIERGRERYRGIPSVDAVSWAELTVLSPKEVWTQPSGCCHRPAGWEIGRLPKPR